MTGLALQCEASQKAHPQSTANPPKAQPAQNLWEQSLLAIAVDQPNQLSTDLPQSRASFAPTGLRLNALSTLIIKT
ncbi:hypothetical protein THH46_00455 [Pseudomonas sp. NA13]